MRPGHFGMVKLCAGPVLRWAGVRGLLIRTSALDRSGTAAAQGRRSRVDGEEASRDGKRGRCV